jgi:hypothetical protein
MLYIPIDFHHCLHFFLFYPLISQDSLPIFYDFAVFVAIIAVAKLASIAIANATAAVTH